MWTIVIIIVVVVIVDDDNYYWVYLSFDPLFQVYYKVRRLFFYKVRWSVITKCDSFFITKCDKCYYKVRQVLQSVTIYYKVRQVLQSATIIKVRQYTRAFFYFCAFLYRSRQICVWNDHFSRFTENVNTQAQI